VARSVASKPAGYDWPDSGKPGRDCPLCPRLVAYREECRAAHPDWFNAPVPSFGPRDAQLLIVGLAPGVMGANRTGRPFTGDFAGDLLYDTLFRYGFANGKFDARLDDGLALADCRITNAARCVPPENKPLPIEITTCRPFLRDTIAEMKKLRAIVALGAIAHASVLMAFAVKKSAHPFKHGGKYDLLFADGRPVAFFYSNHCSRYKTKNGVLTTEMFHNVFAKVRIYLDS
jgi:uracil-DNA glycosylase family 4